MVKVWNTTVAQEVGTLTPFATREYLAGQLAFSPDGNSLAAVLEEGSVRLWPRAHAGGA